jgi:hypothetical protein
MLSRAPRRWLYLVPLLVVLLIVGAAAYALNQAAAASALPSSPKAVNGLNLAGNPDTWNLQPGEKKVLPNGVTVGRDLKHDISPPLRDIPPVPISANHEAPENPWPAFLPPKSLKDPVVQRFFGPLAMPTPILTFEGINVTQGCGGCYPPDTNGEAGPNHYIQTVNSAFAIWDKNGNVVQTPRNINTLFSGFGGACQTQNSGDPTVNYDQLADRWVISQFTSSAPYNQCVAVSVTGDPTGQYYRYAFLESNTALYDYPKIGVWPDAYYLTANVFQGNSFLYPSFIAMDRTQMLQGQTATFQEVNPGSYYSDVLPADLDGSNPPPAGAPEPFLTVAGNNTTIRVWNFHVDFATPANTHLAGPINLAAAPWDPNLCGLARNCIPQPGVSSAAYLDSLGDHTMFRLAYRNFGDHESLVTNESVDENGQDHAGIRWYELRDPNGNPFIYQQGTYAPDADHRWMGSAAQDRDGNLAIGYSVSSSTTFPSIRYAGRLVTDPLGQLGQGEATLIAGSGSQTATGDRWGDYSDMTVDPSDDCTFWYTNEYYATTASVAWRTRVGKFKFPSCGQTTPSPTPTGTPPTNTPGPTATSTVAPPPPACASYTLATATGTIVPATQDIGNHCDDCAVSITLPFPVQLYDRTFTSGYASSNGVLNLGGSDYPFGNACLPVPIFTYAIAGFWDDLITTNTGGGVYSLTTGTAPNRVFNLEWRAQSLTNNQNINFEIQLYETPPGGLGSQVDIVYGTNLGGGGNVATIGIQGPATSFTQYSCNTNSLSAGLKLSFTLPPCPTATPTTVPSNTPTTVPSNTPTTVSNATSTRVASATVTPGGATATPCSITFSDVNTTDYFYEPVRYLYCRGVISGYGDNTFRPYNDTTRAQMVKIVVLGFGYAISTPAAGAYTFHDVPPTAPFWDVIETAAAHNIVSGYGCGPGGPGPCDDHNRPFFLPNNPVTRGQLSKIDVIAAGWAQINPTTPTFTDVPTGSPFYTVIETAVCHGVVSGYADHTFHPFANATRGQISKIVYLSLTGTGGTCAVTPTQ